MSAAESRIQQGSGAQLSLRRRHKLKARATDLAGNVDPGPAINRVEISKR